MTNLSRAQIKKIMAIRAENKRYKNELKRNEAINKENVRHIKEQRRITAIGEENRRHLAAVHEHKMEHLKTLRDLERKRQLG